MALFEAIGDVFEGAVDFADAIFGFSGSSGSSNLLTAGHRIFSGAMGEDPDAFGIGAVEDVATLGDLVSPGLGERPLTSQGLLDHTLTQSRKAAPKSDFWSNPFVGNIAMAVGGELARGDPGEAAEAQYEARRKVMAKNYRLPKRNERM